MIKNIGGGDFILKNDEVKIVREDKSESQMSDSQKSTQRRVVKEEESNHYGSDS